jgi:hypothetical protein
MRSKFMWYMSALVLWLVFCLIGYVGMVFRELESIFDRAPDSVVMMQGAQWMMLVSFISMGILIACALCVTRLRVRRILVDLGLQAGAILFGALFAWTFAQDEIFLLPWAGLYLVLFLNPFVLECRTEDPAWRRWGYVGLTGLTAAYVIGFSSL